MSYHVQAAALMSKASGPNQPASEEIEKSAKLLVEITPSDTTYRSYQRQAKKLLGLPDTFSISPLPEESITGFEMRDSILFQRAYLVAYANPTWFAAELPRMDAVAVANLRLDSGSPPPFVLLSETTKKPQGRFFESLLEHEFVHVNQAIRGAFPASPKGGAKELAKNIFQVTRAEYEAYLIQLTRWPQFYFQHVPRYLREGNGLSLDRWCVQRGYTQGLEEIVGAVAAGRIEEGEFMEFIDGLPAALPPSFRRIGFDQALGREYAANLQSHLLAACQNLSRDTPDGESLYSSLWDRIRQHRFRASSSRAEQGQSQAGKPPTADRQPGQTFGPGPYRPPLAR
jgi:hypothetical protein